MFNLLLHPDPQVPSFLVTVLPNDLSKYFLLCKFQVQVPINKLPKEESCIQFLCWQTIQPKVHTVLPLGI